LYRLFRVIDEPFMWVLGNQIVPGFCVNLLFAVILYVPAVKWSEKINIVPEQEN
jgi:rod shape-determining protein MreD